MLTSFGKRLLQLRKTKLLKQREFAEGLGITASYLSELESDKKNPSRTLLMLMELRYAINLNWLLTGEGGMFLSDTGSLADGRADDPVRKKLIEMMDDLNEDELSDLRKYLREKAEMRNIRNELEDLKRKVG